MSALSNRLPGALQLEPIIAAPDGPPRGRRARHRFAGSLLLAGAVLLILIACLCAPMIAPHGEREVNTKERLQGPSRAHLLGTDQLGRDIFSRLLYGGRTSIPVGLAAVSVAAGLGIALGLLAGYHGGLLDQITGRLVDAQLAFPELVLALAVVSAFGMNLLNIMLVLGLSGFPAFYRLTRGQVLQVRSLEYVQAAEALGASRTRIMLRHILPAIPGPLVISLSLACGNAVLLQSTLGFFGLGPKAGSADWGSMFFDGLNNVRLQPWLAAGPGLAVFLTTLLFFLLGDQLRAELRLTRQAEAPEGH